MFSRHRSLFCLSVTGFHLTRTLYVRFRVELCKNRRDMTCVVWSLEWEGSSCLVMRMRGGLLPLLLFLSSVLGGPRPQYSGGYDGEVDQSMIDVSAGPASFISHYLGLVSPGHIRCRAGPGEVREH